MKSTKDRRIFSGADKKENPWYESDTQVKNHIFNKRNNFWIRGTGSSTGWKIRFNGE
jgi:hypothetical protein